MVSVMLKLVFVQLLFTYIVLSSTQLGISHFKCVSVSGRTPGIVSMIPPGAQYLASRVPRAIGISATQCAALCARSQLNGCQSYSYNSDTKYCFTRNITLSYDGSLCGVPVDLARDKCQRSGDTFIAYGGQDRTMMECICGADARGWLQMTNSLYNCIEMCKNTYPCAIEFESPNVPCKTCNGSIGYCNGVPKLHAVDKSRLVCMPIPAQL